MVQVEGGAVWCAFAGITNAIRFLGFVVVVGPGGSLATVLPAWRTPEPVPRPSTVDIVAAAAEAKQSPTLYAMIQAGKHAREPNWTKIANPACGLAGALLGAMLARRQRPSR